ncbi:hypothetical protein [Natribacillus halophilus]|uniref:Uncharacterized protein n=1 Tax=Natribacillus halophilus TaxID=549003 RepID=A0A1G8LFE5_9BACI|nr:hypothetical protein [Natribacillus halophilus]SDI54391.1 hypothetical protein SAMN04488123_10362 [Natribacillus halophilus]
MTVINVIGAQHKGDGLYLESDRHPDEKLIPTARLLADSDNFALVYIFDREGTFVQVHIHEAFWSDLYKSHRKRTPIYLDKHDVLFEAIHEELDMFLDIIQGNNNYGAEMVSAVEKHFFANE